VWKFTSSPYLFPTVIRFLHACGADFTEISIPQLSTSSNGPVAEVFRIPCGPNQHYSNRLLWSLDCCHHSGHITVHGLPSVGHIYHSHGDISVCKYCLADLGSAVCALLQVAPKIISNSKALLLIDNSHCVLPNRVPGMCYANHCAVD
jgi:hypothetical protein